MKVISIEYPFSLETCNSLHDNIDVFIKLENGNRYCVTVATIEWVRNCVGMKYLPSGAPNIVVKELKKQIIEEAINEYAEDDAYWLRVFSMSYGDVIPD